MVILEMSAEEASIMKEVLQSDLSTLHMEISRADHRGFRDKLKKRVVLVNEMLHRLDAAMGDGARQAA